MENRFSDLYIMDRYNGQYVEECEEYDRVRPRSVGRLVCSAPVLFSRVAVRLTEYWFGSGAILDWHA